MFGCMKSIFLIRLPDNLGSSERSQALSFSLPLASKQVYATNVSDFQNHVSFFPLNHWGKASNLSRQPYHCLIESIIKPIRGISNYYIANFTTYETKSNVSLGQKQKWKEILVHTVLCINWRQMALFRGYANNFQDFQVRDGRNTKYH